MGNPAGSHSEQLRFLAGLLHDAGKSDPAWQIYIHSSQRARGSGPPHAYAGAMLFAACLRDLLAIWKLPRPEQDQLLRQGLLLIQVLYYHHGAWQDLECEAPPWLSKFNWDTLACCNLEELARLAASWFPEWAAFCAGSPAWTAEKLTLVNKGWDGWIRQYLLSVSRFQGIGNPYAQSAKLQLQSILECRHLIASDRMHAAGLNPQEAEVRCAPEDASRSLGGLAEFCKQRFQQMRKLGADIGLLQAREECRTEALQHLEDCQDRRVFTLELPTGYGKTLTALSVALASVASGRCHRIIYVAPYLSILSQAAREITAATGIEVIQQHHLAALDGSLPRGEDEGDEEDMEMSLLNDCWLAPIIATTYNQLFMALFPHRVQDTLRLSGVRNAFVIVDEPQIIGASSWNPFLATLEAALIELNCRVLFVTATLPGLEDGLLETPWTTLAKRAPNVARYSVTSIGEADEQRVAEAVVEGFRATGSVAVILNTIRDAGLVYDLVQGFLSPEERERLFFVSGRLAPLHKAARIAQVRDSLEAGLPTLLVSTQVLEAGVDLTFRRIWRALPLLPSVIQAAGRCNRHGEGQLGQLSVFDFRRGGETDTRPYVYSDAMRRQITDGLLQQAASFDETAALGLVDLYYRRCMEQNRNSATLQLLEEAACGRWSQLTGLTPFEGYIQQGIFVPELPLTLPSRIRENMVRFHAATIRDLWRLYAQPGWMVALSYPEKRRFSALLHQFVVTLPERESQKMGEPTANRSLLLLRYPSVYDAALGLSRVDLDSAVDEQFL